MHEGPPNALLANVNHAKFCKSKCFSKNIAVISISILPCVKLYKKAGHNLMRLEQIYKSSLVSITVSTILLLIFVTGKETFLQCAD